MNLIGAEIAGVLDCSGASLVGGADRDALIAAGAKVGSAVMLGMGFSAEGAVELRGAEIGTELSCANGTQLNGVNTGGAALNARGVRVGGNLLIDAGFRAAGAIFLGDSDISGDVVILGAQLGRSEAGGHSLAASGMKVGGGMVLGGGLTAPGVIDMRGAEIADNLRFMGSTRLDGADVEGNSLQADSVKVGGHLLVEGDFTSSGAIYLVDAEISGNLQCRGIHLRGCNLKGSALHAERITVGNQVYLDQGFRAEGAIYLLGARISGNLECRGAHISSPTGRAMYAERMTVGGDVYLDHYPGQSRFTVNGTVHLHKAEIGGMLSCRGAKLETPSASGYSLFAERMVVGGDVFLNEGFSASDAIYLRAAAISGSLELAPDRLQQDRRRSAIDASDMKVSGRLRWAAAVFQERLPWT